MSTNFTSVSPKQAQAILAGRHIHYHETPEMRLIGELCEALGKARDCISKGKPSHALVEVEYALECIVPDSFAEHPEMARRNPVVTR